MIQVETASVSEADVIDKKEPIILDDIQPDTLSGDNSYAKAMRIRRWAKRQVILLSPAFR